MQSLLTAFSDACSEFQLTISNTKTQNMVQGDTERPTHFIDNEELEVVDQFTYKASLINNKLPLDQEINIRIGKAATTMNRLTKKVWDNKKLTTKTKIIVYKA
jgi:hypothetical protein